MKIIYALIGLMTACGADPGVSKQQPAGTTSTATSPTTNDNAAPITATTAVATSSDSVYVIDAAHLPKCDAASEGRLAYISSIDTLNACVNDVWTPIHLKGAVGDTGPAGASGTNGKDGVAGKDGSNGKDGMNGQTGAAGPAGANGLDASPGLNTIWSDPDTLIQWVIVSKKSQLSMSSCPTGFTLPTNVDRLTPKFIDYFMTLISTMPSNATYWTGTVNGSIRYVGTMDGQTISSDNTPGTSQHVYLCRN